MSLEETGSISLEPSYSLALSECSRAMNSGVPSQKNTPLTQFTHSTIINWMFALWQA